VCLVCRCLPREAKAGVYESLPRGMPILQTNTLPIRDIQICDGWCLPPCWKRKTIPHWLWCDAVCDYSKCQVIDAPDELLARTYSNLSLSRECLFLCYQLEDLDGVRRCKKNIADILTLLEKYK
jgi:hypothetical protein